MRVTIEHYAGDWSQISERVVASAADATTVHHAIMMAAQLVTSSQLPPGARRTVIAVDHEGGR